MSLKGWVDFANTWEIRGWAFDPDNPGRKSSVDIFVNGKLAVSATGKNFRKDLKQAGIGDGCCSFFAGIAPYLTESGTHRVEVRFSGTSQVVPNGLQNLHVAIPIKKVCGMVAEAPQYASLSYATVRDYCESADYFPDLARLVGDMKDTQRPWMMKAILNRFKPGAKLLEVGSGEPIVASRLATLGFDVTICDPFDGCGNGPVDFDSFKSSYPNVTYIRSYFTPDVAKNLMQSFDAIFSISVVEHVPADNMDGLFKATEMSLKPGGCSLHAMDVVLEGNDDLKHHQHLALLLALQERVSGGAFDLAGATSKAELLMSKARADLETYYLSAAGHNLWRGATPYNNFPFRKCISAHTISRRN